MVKPLRAVSNFAITSKCNGRCKMCNIWKKEPVEDPSIEKIEEFFRQNQGFLKELEFIQLTGGEPFLRDDLPEIIELVNHYSPSCMIWVPTNGLLPERIHETTVDALKRIDTPRLGITVSLDGDAEVNDAQRGIEGSFKQAVTTIKSLSELKSRGLYLSTGFTLTNENYVYAPIVQKIAYRLGSDFSFRPVNFSEHYYQNAEQQQNLPVEEITPYLDYVAINLMQRKGAFGCITNLAYTKGAKDFINGTRTLPCSAASESVFIDVLGDVYPCLVMNRKLGNIYQNTLEDILSSPSAWDARDTISRLECPTCWLECEVYRDIKKEKKRLFEALISALKLSAL